MTNAERLHAMLHEVGIEATYMQSDGVFDVITEDRDGQFIFRFDEDGETYLFSFYAEDEDE